MTLQPKPQWKRDRGTGSVDFHQGRWRARLPGKGRVLLGHFDDEAEAHRTLEALRELGELEAELGVESGPGSGPGP